MNINRRIPMLTLAACMALTTATAQKTDKKEKDKKKSQTITIVRSGDSDEKITVEVNGDKVTVNGKPVEEYKGGDIEIITGATDVLGMTQLGKLWTPKAPMATGAWDNDKFISWGGNEAFLGVTTEKTADGVRITEVTKESAAEKAGLKEGDIITRIGETTIAEADDVYTAIGKQKPEEKVTITYKRNGAEQTTTATLEKNKHSFGHTFSNQDFMKDFNFDFDTGNGRVVKHGLSRKPRLGLQIEDLEQGNGVKVLDVNAETPAGKAGLQKDDKGDLPAGRCQPDRGHQVSKTRKKSQFIKVSD